MEAVKDSSSDRDRASASLCPPPSDHMRCLPTSGNLPAAPPRPTSALSSSEAPWTPWDHDSRQGCYAESEYNAERIAHASVTAWEF